jgi:hypothetical protein
MRTEATCAYETFVTMYQVARRHIPGDWILNLNHSKNLISLAGFKKKLIMLQLLDEL